MPRDALRKSHVGITLNDQSSKMEDRLELALSLVVAQIRDESGLELERENTLALDELVDALNRRYSDDLGGVNLERGFRQHERTWLKPDGGFWYVKNWDGPRRWVLVAEAKRQGTRCAREVEGLPRQARGNAIERLGKNLRGFDALFLGEAITPVVVFGEGCDFEPESSILDRVATMNGFFPLNQVHVDKINLAIGDTLKPVTMFFRHNAWTPGEMYGVLVDVTRRSIGYYRERYSLE